MHGRETWVVLPDDSENGDASFEHTAADDIPVIEGVRVVAGTGWSMEVTGGRELTAGAGRGPPPTDAGPIDIEKQPIQSEA